MIDEQSAASKAVRRYGARLAKTRRWDQKTANVVARAYGDEMAKRFERRAPYFQHQPTGLYVQHKASVINTATQLTGEHEYSIPGIGHAAIIPADELRPAHAEVDVVAAARHNRALLARSPWSSTIRRMHRPPSDAGPQHTVGEGWEEYPRLSEPHKISHESSPTCPRCKDTGMVVGMGSRKWPWDPARWWCRTCQNEVKPPVGEGWEDTMLWGGRGTTGGAWISPRGQEHFLQRGQNHYDWVHANAERLGVTMPKKLVRSAMGDTTEPEHELLKAGWIKKSDATVYEAHKLDNGVVHRIRRHMREYHPDDSHFALQVGHGRGTKGYSFPVWEQLETVQRLVLEACAGAPIGNLVSALLE